MRIQIMSDLHMEFDGAAPIPALVDGTDVVVIAGDTCRGLVRAVEILRDAFPVTEVVAVAGNHEYYGAALPVELNAGRERARQLGVHLLSDDAVRIGTTRFLGCTLWTDYCLFGASLRAAAMATARDVMTDHKRIKWSKDPWLRFRPEEAAMLHARSRKFLETELARAQNGPVVVATHHAMTLDAVAPKNQRSLVSAAYASELLPLVDRHRPSTWITGHTHFAMNRRRDTTRLISNPRGYPQERTSFDPTLTLEISDD